MNRKKPTYKELEEKLARAEEIISVFRDQGNGGASYERDTVLRDTRELKEVYKEAYRESEQNFRNSMEACPLGIRVVTEDGELIYANPAILEITGYPTVQELKSVPRKQLYTPESYAAHQERKEKRKRGEDVPLEYETSIRRPDGEVRTLHVFRREIIWGGERQYMAMYLDITDRRQAERALKESQDKFLKAFVSSPDAIVISRLADGKILEVNDAWEKYFGYTREETIGNNALSLELIAPEDRQRGISLLKEQGLLRAFEINFKRKTGEVMHISMSAELIEIHGEQCILTNIHDITARLKAEEAIKSREDFLNSVIENTPSPLWVSDGNGTVIRMNQALRDLMKIKNEEIIGKYNVLEDVQVIEQGFLPLVKSVFDEGKTVNFTLDYQTAKESQVNLSRHTHLLLEIVISAVKDERGKVIHAICQEKDITDRKKAEEALKESEARFRSLFETTNQGVVYQDAAGTIMTTNPAAQAILGLTLSQLEGRTPLDPRWKYLQEDGSEYPRNQHPAMVALRTGRPVNNIIMAVFNADAKEYRWIMISAIPEFREGQDEPHRVYSTFTDITGWKKAQAALEESEERYRTSLDNMIEGCQIIGRDWRYLYLNDVVAKQGRYKKEELLGRTMMEAYPGIENSEMFQFVKKCMEKRIPHRMENEFVFADGSSGWFELSIQPVPEGVFIISLDITERKQLEEKLEMQHQELKLIIDSSPVLVWHKDKEGKFLRVNRAFAEALNIPEEHFIGKTVYDLYSADIARGMTRDDREVLESRKSKLNIIEQYKSASGLRWVQTDKIPILDEKGNATGVIGFAQDITERRESEMAIHQSEERFRRIFQEGPLGIVLSNLDYKYTMMNARFCQMFGYSEKEMIGMTFKNISFQEDVPEDINNLQKLAKDELAYYETEKRYINKNGDVFWGSLTATLLRDNMGKPQGFLAMIQDVTERRQAEERINHLNLAMRSLRNISQLITREKDRDRLIKGICDNLVVNRSFSSAWIILLDDSRQPVTWAETQVGSAFTALVNLFKKGEMPRCVQKALTQKRVVVTKDPHEQCACCPVFGDNKEIGSMTVRLELDGQLYGILCASMLRSMLTVEDEKSLFDEVAGDIAFALRDIELETANDLLKQERLRAAKLESIGTLAGGIAHDFNNLLTGIMGNIGLAKTYFPPSETVFDILDEAEKAAARSRDLTQQLLTFARGGKPIKRLVSIAKLVKDSATFALRGSKVRLELSLPDDLWKVEADEGQISQVIQNLVINADEAMPRGGVLKIEAKNLNIKRMGILPLSGGKYVQIDICDTGVGISAEHLQRIFEPYFTTKRQGSGLGLTTAYSIIKNHGGFLLAESTLNKGSVFHLYLPASKKTTKGEKRVAAKKSAQAGGKVLIMDDDETIRKMLKNMLNLAGYEAEVTADGVEALEKYKQAMEAHDPFTAVIMDLTIPGGMGGKEAIKKLLEIDPGASVVVSSGYATDAIMSEYKKYGFKAVIAKPYSITQLQETISGLTPKKK